MDLFDSVSPLDYRYYGREDSLVKELGQYFSENARIKYQARVEAALANALAKKGICSEKIAKEISEAAEKVSAEEVYAEEDRIKHDVRALANCIRAKVSGEAKPFVHFSATSYDIIDSANALRYKEATERVVLPALKELEKSLIELALNEKSTLQIGRTHGQHAEPITFGFALAEYVDRLGNRIKAIGHAKDSIVGKFSGAVGAHNAASLFFDKPLEFEAAVLHELGLKAALHSTQIVAPEPVVDLAHAAVSAFSVLANFADDMRNLQRSEIAEVAEQFSGKQVGSSTMPHKRNPINFENVKSLYKEFMPRMNTVYLDQISEHQRDLTNSASSRFMPELFVALIICAKRLNKVCKGMVVDKASMHKNFMQSRNLLVAEPLYILLAYYGHADAHEYVRELTLKAKQTEKSLWELAMADNSIREYVNKFTPKQKGTLSNPEQYVGIAEKKTEGICEHWSKELDLQ
ncbi:MAG: adenylosuccinate lyase [Candidatus Diapherotrites archaeon]|nr:adenylosuccinate lyase [Candidatus Diapherotrites archaeon]